MKLMKALMVVCAVMCLLTACGKEDPTVDESAVVVTDGATLGEGATAFALEITDLEGETVAATIRTNATTVGAALQGLHIIDGEEDVYGLYVKTVNGLTLDYDKHGAYWSFYINGSYANAGVDKTAINPTAIYALKAEKA